jgi:glutathione S-transferase
MRLIGMLDSPYVRRVAVSLNFMGLPCKNEQTSVFRHFDQFAAINPVVKAPTLVTDDGVVLMESTLILDYLEKLAPGKSLMPATLTDYTHGQRLTGLALAACEKAVQIVYEQNLRPAEKQHQPWLERVGGQLNAAWGAVESEIGDGGAWLFGDTPLIPDITIAVGWQFTRMMVADAVPAPGYPALCRFSARAEALPQFIASPPD